jgi:hypothetical protein
MSSSTSSRTDLIFYINSTSPFYQDGSPVPAIMSHQEPEPQSRVGGGGAHPLPPPVPRHNYANVNSSVAPTASSSSTNGGPSQQQQQQHHNGARPRPTNPLYGQKSGFDFDRTYSEMDRTVGPVVTYEAETLRADTKVTTTYVYKCIHNTEGSSCVRLRHLT